MSLGRALIVRGNSTMVSKLQRAGFTSIDLMEYIPSQSFLANYKLLVIGRGLPDSIPQYVKDCVFRGELSIISEWDGTLKVAQAYGVSYSSHRADSLPNGHTKTNIAPIGHSLHGLNLNTNSSGDYEHFTRFSFTNLSQVIPLGRNDNDSHVFLAELRNVGAGRVILFGSDWADAITTWGILPAIEDAIFKFVVSPNRPANATDETKLLSYSHNSSYNVVTNAEVITPGGKKIIDGVNTVKVWASGDFNSTSETLEIRVDDVVLFGPNYLGRTSSESSNLPVNYVGEFNLPLTVIGKSTVPFRIQTSYEVGYGTIWLEFKFSLVPTLVPMDDAGIPFPEAIQKRENILSLRQQANKFRKDNGMEELKWTDPNVVAGLTPIKAKHWNELEAAVKEVYDNRAVPIAVPEVKKQFEEPIKSNDKKYNVKQLSGRIFNILRSFRNY